MTLPGACRQVEIALQTYHTWKRKCHSMDVDSARKLKSLEKENAELKKIVGELTLDNRILKAVSERAKQGATV